MTLYTKFFFIISSLDTFEVFQNIELISRASFFVGYEWSTYSDLIASLSALRVYLKQGGLKILLN